MKKISYLSKEIFENEIFDVEVHHVVVQLAYFHQPIDFNHFTIVSFSFFLTLEIGISKFKLYVIIARVNKTINVTIAAFS